MSLQNRVPLTATDLHALFGAEAIVPPYYASVGIATDTRTMEPGTLFVALRGERFDAHDRIYYAMVRGAAGIVIEERWLDTWNATLGKEFPSFARVVVPDTLVALGALASFHRRRFSIPVIAVAGANGKTTTKDMIAHVLSATYPTLKTHSNNNNRVGAPLTLMQLTARTGAAVIEIGTNEPGEIEALSAIVAPTHALITNIGEEHLEKLIDLDGVEKEETALFRWAARSNAAMIVNKDDERLRDHASHAQAWSFATETDADVRATVTFDAELHPHLQIDVRGVKGEAILQATGHAAALNAVAAIATCVAVGIPVSDALERCAAFVPDASHGYARMVVENGAACVILNDCYNANPASMRMALKTLRDHACRGRRIAVLGDMRELGAAEARAHAEIVEEARRSCDLLIVAGTAMTKACGGQSGKISVFETTDTCVSAIRSLVHEGDVVLVKASRGMAFENVVAALR
ncbi:MAG: UDP-N-acetylmuramoyl-tripeptide--D-alanyl-D-alanine ligase [Candidatus Kapaibacterium sp.]